MSSSGFRVLALLLLVAGCRNLVTESPPPPPNRFGIVGKVVDPQGLGTQATVLLSNSAYAPSGQRASASTTTDATGGFELDLPWGLYDVEIGFPAQATLPDFEREGIDFGGDVVRLEYDADPQRGRILLPNGFDWLDPDDAEVRFKYDKYEFSPSFRRSILARLTPSGRFEVWLHDDEFFVDADIRSDFSGFRVRGYWDQPVLRNPTEELQLTLDVVPVVLRLTLGGDGRPPAGTTIVARQAGGPSFTQIEVAGTSTFVPMWAFPGPTELEITDDGDEAFVGQSRFVEITENAFLPIELGETRVEIHLRDDAGRPAVGAGVTVEGARGDLRTETDPTGTATVFLAPDVYLLQGTYASRSGAELVTVSADTTVVLELR